MWIPPNDVRASAPGSKASRARARRERPSGLDDPQDRAADRSQRCARGSVGDLRLPLELLDGSGAVEVAVQSGEDRPGGAVAADRADPSLAETIGQEALPIDRAGEPHLVMVERLAVMEVE